MKKIIALVLVLCLSFAFSVSAFAVGTRIGQDTTNQDAPLEPIVTPDTRAIQLEEKPDELVVNGANDDDGSVWISWSDTGNSKYGCSNASINYTNPVDSNIGMVLSIGIMDSNLVNYFGTTFKTDEEILELATKGFDALQRGIYLAPDVNFLNIELPFNGMDSEEIYGMDKETRCNVLAVRGFMDMTAEELGSLTLEDIESLDEIKMLELAQLGGYNFFTSFITIAEAGVINPGYALYDIDLHTIGNGLSIPKGDYECVFVLNGYDHINNRLSDFFIHLPLTLTVEEDITPEIMEEYGIGLATRIDV